VQLFLFLVAPDLLQRWQPYFGTLIRALEISAIIYCIAVFVISIRRINNFQRQLQNQFADIEQRSLAWIKNILVKVFFLMVLWIVPYVFAAANKGDVNDYMYPLWIGMTIVVYWLAWSMFSRRDLFEYTPPRVLQPVEVANGMAKEDRKDRTAAEKWEIHYKELTRLMEDEKLFLDPEISMTTLARKMQLSNGYLSQMINQVEGLNFYDYINRYRVEEVKKRLDDPKFSNLSLYGLAIDCGFRSKSTFNGVFKKMTGLTPSEFRKKGN
jgi:AraC-like DNA-binding protein